MEEKLYKLQAEDIQIRAFEDCVYLSISIATELSEDNERLARALEKMPLPNNFNFDKNGLTLVYQIENHNDGFVCDIGWLIDQFRKIFSYAENLMPYQEGS